MNSKVEQSFYTHLKFEPWITRKIGKGSIMSKADFVFLENQAGEAEGLGHAGIETFRDTPYASCAREAGQNSLDAADGKPVKMTFLDHEIPISEVPASGKLREAISSCLKEAMVEKEVDFFKHAKNLISKKTIRVLEISDYNTRGLMGPPNDAKSPFHLLVKATGKSNDKSDTSGGSFGIGKNASFAISDLRTAFYSTVYEMKGQFKSAVQGKSQLVSHTDKNGVHRMAKGYWGNSENFAAVECYKDVPEWLQRKEKGTSIFALGFRHDPDWKDRMTVALLNNFFLAVLDGDIEFTIGNTDARAVRSDTVRTLFKNSKIENVATSTAQSANFELARQLFRCCTSGDTIAEKFEIQGLGTFRARILVADGLPRRVAIIRNGMMITQSLEHFDDKLIRFGGAKDFIMLVEPVSKSASSFLKKLENPQHNGFSAERVSDAEKRFDAERLMKKLAKRIRELVRENANMAGENSVRLDELGEFFSDAGQEETPIAADETDPTNYVYTPVKRKPAQKFAVPDINHDEGQSGGGGSNNGEGGAGTDGHGAAIGDGQGGFGGATSGKPIKLDGIRNRISKSRKRVIYFTPAESGVIELALLATGVFDGSHLKIVKTDSSNVTVLDNGNVEFVALERQRTSLEVETREKYTGPIEIAAKLRVEQ